MTDYLILVPIAYLLGSVPFGLIAGRLVANVDVRDYGSGKIGMTNVLRTSGKTAAAVVLFLDMGKGVLAVVIGRVFFDSYGVEVAAALAVLFGHNWPIFIRFRGGRGTASGWGGLLILSPIAGIIATFIGITMISVTRYVSLGSIMAASLGSLALIFLAVFGDATIEYSWYGVWAPPVYSWYGVIGGTLIVIRHWDNIRRLIDGTERKIGQSVDLSGSH